MIREDILQKFPELFGTKKINGREVNVEAAIATLTRELGPEIAAALTARRALLQSPAPVTKRYAWPKWDDTFEDAVTGQFWTFRQIIQGLIDNVLGRDSEWRWRLNDEVPIPGDAHPLTNPGLELTGPWHPLDMAFNALNSPAPMNMPDFEDASPPHFQPDGTPRNEPLGIFAAMQNAKEILEGRWAGRPYEVVKKGQPRAYKINTSPAQWPTRFARPPGIHVRYDHVVVEGQPVPGVIPIILLWTLNNYGSLTQAGTGVYYYIPKIQTPQEALIVEKLLARVEGMIGVQPGTIKIKVLYEEGNAGRFLPAIAWVLRRRLLGTNVGRWDYLASLIEMWKDDPQGVFPDPQSIGMASPNMIAYQRYNALMMLMAGMKNGELSQGAPIGGMAAVMIYQRADPYGRSRYNPLALRAMVIDKLRETGVRIEEGPDNLRVRAPRTLRASNVTTIPFPGFPTDMQAQYMALMTQATGTSTITESIFENRYMHVAELQRMGANIRVEGRTAIVTGHAGLSGAWVMATDLRASACLVLAGLAAVGETIVDRVYHLDRGYYRIDEKLRGLGADIERVERGGQRVTDPPVQSEA